jgi:hypothetical protein
VISEVDEEDGVMVQQELDAGGAIRAAFSF